MMTALYELLRYEGPSFTNASPLAFELGWGCWKGATPGLKALSIKRPWSSACVVLSAAVRVVLWAWSVQPSAACLALLEDARRQKQTCLEEDA